MNTVSETGMALLPTEKAVGQVLCHDLTRIADGYKGPQFKKGHIITQEDIPILLSMGKEHLYIWRRPPDSLHEDEAAERLAAICAGDNITQKGPSEGKIELFAVRDGLFVYDRAILDAINDIPLIVIAARHNHVPVSAGDKLAGTKTIPLVINQDAIKQAEATAGGKPIMNVLPYRRSTAAVVTTGTEIAKGRIKDAFTPLLIAKLESYGISVIKHIVVPDGTERVAAAIAQARAAEPSMLLCTGGMSVDPDDNTPGAIKMSGANVVTYGAPVAPGLMFLLAYFTDGTPIMGVPGCVMAGRPTLFDMVLPRIAAGEVLTRRDFTRLGAGGLCLGCKECHYPVCPFGKAAD
jgi:hypothetical protein